MLAGLGAGGLFTVDVILDAGGDLEVGVVRGDLELEDLLLFCMMRAFSSTLFLKDFSELLIVNSSLCRVRDFCPVKMILEAGNIES